MSKTAETTYPTADSVQQALAGVSKDFARSARHVASACSTSLRDIVVSIQKGELTDAAQIVSSLAESKPVMAATAALNGISIKAAEIADTLKRLGPWAQVIVGLVAIPAGYFLVGGLLGALVIVAGVCIAYGGILKVIERATGEAG